MNERLIDIGPSGLLSPDGHFYQCGYGEHGELANRLIHKGKLQKARNEHSLVAEYDWLYFGGTFISGEKASKEQKEFLRVNLEQLSLEQRDYALLMFLNDEEVVNVNTD